MIDLEELNPLIERSVTIANFSNIFSSLDETQKSSIFSAIEVFPERWKWMDGRANLPLWGIFDSGLDRKLLWNILDKAKFTSRGGNSKTAISLPFEMTEDFAYFLGVLAGDGHISKPKVHQRKWWIITMCEDDREYQKNIYVPLCRRLFGYSPKIHINKRTDGRRNLFSRINSFILVLFLTTVIGIKNGHKVCTVSMPDAISRHTDIRIRNAFVGGLFDTDGTVTCGRVKYSTVSPILFHQVKEVLEENGIDYTESAWLKNGKANMLCTIMIRKKDLAKFSEVIGFKNLRKRIKLDKILALSSSG